MNKKLPALSVDGVSVAYDGAAVVHDIVFYVKPGEFFGLMGLNGAGKTTLIKSILGLRDVQKGRIQVFGNEPGSAGGKAGLAYLPERFEPPWFMTGLEFVEFSLGLYNHPFVPDDIFEQAQKLALDPSSLRRRVDTYSKGMRQKLGLLAVVFTNCRLFILDEPMSGLDPLARSLVKDVLLECRGKGQTVFLCSHILSDMEEICDRVALLHKGRLEFVGKPETLKKKAGAKTLERAFMHFIQETTAV